MLNQTEWGQKLQQAWLGLALREQRLLILLLLVLIGFGSYQFVWKPIQTAQQQAQVRLNQAQADWQWLNQQAPIVKQAQSQPSVKLETQSQIMAHLQQTLRQQQLIQHMETIRPMQQSVQVVFNRVEAPKFFKWLQSLERQGLLAERLQIEPLEQGILRVTLSYKVER
jgi:general secretion pathway protein M